MHQVIVRRASPMACRPAPRTPSTRARSRATDGFSAITSCMGGPAYRLSKPRGAAAAPAAPHRFRRGLLAFLLEPLQLLLLFRRSGRRLLDVLLGILALAHDGLLVKTIVLIVDWRILDDALTDRPMPIQEQVAALLVGMQVVPRRGSIARPRCARGD